MRAYVFMRMCVLFPDFDECARDPCQNDGTCVDKVNTFECICREYYRGRLCQHGEHAFLLVI